MSKLLEDYIKSVEKENEMLRDKLRDMERRFGFRNKVPVIFNLTSSETKIMGLLLERDQANKDQLMTAIMYDRPADQEPEIKIVDVYICKIRNKLRKFGIKIDTLWGRGYRIDDDSKSKVRSYLNEAEANSISVLELSSA